MASAPTQQPPMRLRQPFLAAYILFTVVSILVRVPYLIITSFRSCWHPRPTWRLYDILIVNILRAILEMAYATDLFPGTSANNTLNGENDFRDFSDDESICIDPLVTSELERGDPEVLEAMRVNDVRPSRVRGWCFAAPAAQEMSEVRGSERIVLYFHGGGYISGTCQPGRPGSASSIARRILDTGAGRINRILAIDYRLSRGPPFTDQHVNPFPAALVDALTAYTYTTNVLGYSGHDIILAGDSVGGQIALNVDLYIARSPNGRLKQPGALLLLHPTLDWECLYSDSIKRNACSDYVSPILSSGYSASCLRGRLSKNWLGDSVYASPASAVATYFKGLPPAFIVAGEAEQMVDSIRAFAVKLEEAGVQIRYAEYEDAYHCFVAFGGLHTARMLRDMAEWLDGVFSAMA